MKVLIIAHNQGIQGAGIAFANLCNGLASMGIKVIAVVPSSKGVAQLIDKNDNIRMYVIKYIKNEVFPNFRSIKDKIRYLPRLIRVWVYRPFFRSRLEEIVKIETPDIIHSNTGTIRIGSEVAERNNIPHVWHVRECQKLGYNYKPFGGEGKVRDLFERKNNHCIAITKSVYDYYRLNSTKDKIIYDGVFSDKIIQTLRTNVMKNKVLLYVGLLSEKKGVRMLLESFERISHKIKDYELWLVGNDQIGIKDIISKMQAKSQIKYLGFRSDIYKLMAESKVVVVPSEYEGFGFITVEAMLNGTMVVGRDTAGTKEQFDNGNKLIGSEIGFRFITENELDSQLLRAISLQEKDYVSITEKAFKVVSNMYSIEKHVNNVIEYYHEILEEKYSEY